MEAKTMVSSSQSANNVPQLAQARLKETTYAALERVACEYHEGVVVVGRLDEVKRVINRIEVSEDNGSAPEDRWR
jgi:hypothetical protein